MRSLKNFFILPQRAIETFHYQGYVIQLQKERPIQAKRKKIAQKICTKKMSQPINTNMFIKNIENLRLIFVKGNKIVYQMTPIIEII